MPAGRVCHQSTTAKIACALVLVSTLVAESRRRYSRFRPLFVDRSTGREAGSTHVKASSTPRHDTSKPQQTCTARGHHRWPLTPFDCRAALLTEPNATVLSEPKWFSRWVKNTRVLLKCSTVCPTDLVDTPLLFSMSGYVLHGW